MSLELLSRLKSGRIAALLLFVAGLVVWSPSLHGGYVGYDTPWLVVDNPLLSTGDLSHISTIWWDLSLGTRRTLGSEYLPVRDTTVLLDFWLFGSSWFAHHVMNLMWYLGACLLFHRLLLRWLEDPRLALGASALFMLHPLHVESVAWLASRKDVVSLVFFFASILAWEKAQDRGWGWMFGSAALMLLACWAKNTAIVLPAVLFLIALGRDWDGLRRRGWWAQWAPFGVVLLLVVWMSLRTGEQVGMFREPWADDQLGLLSLQSTLFARYLGGMVLPLGLSALYEPPSSGWDHLSPWLGVISLIAIVGLGTRMQRTRPLITVGLGWFLVCLAPVSPWLSIQNLQADRYMLLPSAGLALAVGAAWSMGIRWIRPLRIGGCVALTGFAVLTASRCLDWHSSERLWRSTVESQPGRVDGWSALGGVVFEDGREAEAEALILEGLELHPGHPRLLQSLGTLRLQMGPRRWAEAEADLRAALEADPTRMKAGNNLAKLLLKTGREEEALPVIQRLMMAREGYLDGWVTQGMVLMKLDRHSEAYSSFYRAHLIDPYSAKITQKLARSAWQDEKNDEGSSLAGEALRWSLRTLELEPGHKDAARQVRALGGQ